MSWTYSVLHAPLNILTFLHKNLFNNDKLLHELNRFTNHKPNWKKTGLPDGPQNCWQPCKENIFKGNRSLFSFWVKKISPLPCHYVTLLNFTEWEEERKIIILKCIKYKSLRKHCCCLGYRQLGNQNHNILKNYFFLKDFAAFGGCGKNAFFTYTFLILILSKYKV